MFIDSIGKRIVIIFCIAFALLFYCTHSTKAEENIDIYSLEYPNSSIINMGPCYLGDSLHTLIAFKYYGDSLVFIQNGEPTVIVSKSEFDDSDAQNEFNYFNPDLNRGRYTYNFNGSDSVDAPFYYYADPTDGLNPEGWFYANLETSIAYQATQTAIEPYHFILKAKKTAKYLECYEELINFDSVYINPTLAKSMDLRIKSTFKDNIVTGKSSIHRLSPYADEVEFIEKDYTIAPTLPKKYQVFNWELQYQPINSGLDSVLYYLHFYPDKTAEPNTTDSISVKLVGIGVEQSLQIIQSNMDFSGDTIDLGYIPTGYKATITGRLKNNGNMPFIALSEKTEQFFSEDASELLKIQTKGFGEDALAPEETTDFSLEFQVDELGIFFEKYVIESNILERNIFGVPASAVKKIIYVRGVGAAPQLRLSVDVLDYGNVVINEALCPSQSDSTILISNIGSKELIVNNISIEPNIKFKVSDHSFVIPAGRDTALTVSFIASDGQYGEVEAKLKFETNDLANRGELILKANGIPRKPYWLNMPTDKKIFPGKIVEIPIIIEDKDLETHPITRAKNFTTRISFDSTVLNYINRNIIGTASEASSVIIQNINAGTIELTINNVVDYFPAIDTLINLQFRAFLGNEPTSTIAFQIGHTKFGDGLCGDVIDITDYISNGLVSIDSLCGVQYKAHLRNGSALKINSLSPNPANQKLEVNITTKIEDNIYIEIYDIEGNKLQSQKMPNSNIGDHTCSLDVSNYSSNNYYLIVRCGPFRKVQLFNIIR